MLAGGLPPLAITEAFGWALIAAFLAHRFCGFLLLAYLEKTYPDIWREIRRPTGVRLAFFIWLRLYRFTRSERAKSLSDARVKGYGDFLHYSLMASLGLLIVVAAMVLRYVV